MRGLCYFFLSVLTQIHASSDKVIGLIGHNVTLPCRYDTKTNGLLAFCWGRGEVPRFKCSETILSSPGGAVLSLGEPSNLRYQLLGSMMDGEVSLTILNAQQSDAGVYGCRVEIPGWFNDIKVNIDLVMEEAPVEQPVTQDYVLFTSGRQEVLTVSEVVGSTLDSIMPAEKKFKAFLAVENISRIAAIFFFTIIIIPVFIFRRWLLQKVTPEHINTPAAENIYETV
ncbi:T-cell immunoglobulin and mucin domain-containing protein 4-like [Thunnus thynnus]|uniref:T-cell immunoglobulin and mucin domain-containing protein 4-like n=1 Tax=Thunnus thynnus TaxID=8237 RepID=UPI0035296E1E